MERKELEIWCLKERPDSLGILNISLLKYTHTFCIYVFGPYKFFKQTWILPSRPNTFNDTHCSTTPWDKATFIFKSTISCIEEVFS